MGAVRAAWAVRADSLCQAPTPAPPPLMHTASLSREGKDHVSHITVSPHTLACHQGPSAQSLLTLSDPPFPPFTPRVVPPPPPAVTCSVLRWVASTASPRAR